MRRRVRRCGRVQRGCESDDDGDGICDDVDDCVGAYDAVGVCNGGCALDEDADGNC